jgi:hypothetical protein
MKKAHRRRGAAAPAAKGSKAGRVQDADVERTPRRMIGAGGTLLMVALAIVGTTESDVGAWLGLGALVLVIYGLHRFGRLGPAASEGSASG